MFSVVKTRRLNCLQILFQIERGSIALSLEYHFSNESYVPGRVFRR